MKARCTYCKKHWNISVLQEIPKDGYVCPWCASKLKGEKAWKSKKQLIS